MAQELVDVDQLVVDMAKQHQVGDIVGEQGRPHRVAARAAGRIGDDVGHEAELGVLVP